MYKLIGPDGKQYLSEEPGTLGGHRGMKIYGKLDCRSALQAIARPTGGTYISNRVFFADEQTAIAAGYPPATPVCASTGNCGRKVGSMNFFQKIFPKRLDITPI